MKNQGILKIKQLLEKGVKISNPGSIEIDDEVVLDRISGEGVVIYSGSKIFGSSTLILQGAKIGYEGPVTIDNCQIGPDVELKAGFFKEAVFLKKVSIGSGAQVRAGTILEEGATAGHTVGLKQTILFPFVTLGSLINFCDCFMSGGTSQKNHSEVGSSYIHFNYTPNQDKATPSLIGDVPRGAMLNQKPIFLGGQGGLVGPCRLEFGAIIAAGSIQRKDELRPGRLIVERIGEGINTAYSSGKYLNFKRIIKNNIIYIANLRTLMQWYIHVRSQFISDEFPEELFDGLKEKLNMAIEERIKRLKEYYFKIRMVKKQKDDSENKWSELEESLAQINGLEGDPKLRDTFLEKIHSSINKAGKNYISVIKGLTIEDAETGTMWLQGIVDQITEKTIKIVR